MKEQQQAQTPESLSPQGLDKSIKEARVKAAFNVLDRFVKIYNSGETYLRRAVTLFGLGSIIAGVSYGAGQQFNATLPNPSANSSAPVTVSAPQQTVSATTTERSPTVVYVPIASEQQSVNVTPTPVKTVSSTDSKVNHSTPAPVKAQQESEPSKVNSKPKTPTLATPTSGQTTDSAPVEPSVQPSESEIARATEEVQQVVAPIEEVGNAIVEVKETVTPLQQIVSSDEDASEADDDREDD